METRQKSTFGLLADGLPHGVGVRPLTFVDAMTHMGTLLEAMRGNDVDFAIVARSRAAYYSARWIGLPLYFHLSSIGYGAFADGRLAGLVYLHGRRQALHVAALAVHPDFRRRGIGRALLRLAERQARRLRRERVSLRVTTTNEAALRLYESEGFRPARETGSQAAVKITMLKSLTSAPDTFPQEGANGN